MLGTQRGRLGLTSSSNEQHSKKLNTITRRNKKEELCLILWALWSLEALLSEKKNTHFIPFPSILCIKHLAFDPFASQVELFARGNGKSCATSSLKEATFLVFLAWWFWWVRCFGDILCLKLVKAPIIRGFTLSP